ncbi:alanine racemase [Sulfurimonas aquatica]|uniref:Alanine racemase n=1 Tax=Sulfurimonas aquatica TaxID=2672570 RepID=A0A975AYM3_9BACT|nr:alanine racemase [Sulfurimonas aquatica]QSZ40900.1 alanine racemase [Sulfurimonas aquatica]
MSYITLSRENFFYNLDKIAKQTKSVDKIALVLKDNAYGHGICEMASLAKEYGVTKAVVRSNNEAKKVEEFFEYVLVLADIPQEKSPKVRYTINDISAIKKFPKDTLVELKVNTGMNRNGISMDEVQSVIELIQEQGLKLEAIFTHHGCADELNGVYELQKSNFLEVKKSSPKGLRFHSCNSAALFRESDFSEDMARVGIAAYGCMELPREISLEEFKPVLSLYAQKISSQVVKKGEYIGYGATLEVCDECLVSNYDIGYGDGFFRANSNVYETPEGVKIAGRVSMDNSSFLSNEEELLLFNDASKVAEVVGTISYEVLTSLKAYIKRQIV